MPALLEDPLSPLVYRMSGDQPYPTTDNPHIPSSIFPRPVTLRDRSTVATLIPFFDPADVPRRLLAYLSDNLNKEIEGGDTYPMIDTMSLETFGKYWFGNFGAVMVLGDIGGIEAVDEMERTGADWNKLCLGSFYVKPNYPGRSSHVCNGGFLVTPAARNKGVGKSMGQCYLDWAPQLVGLEAAYFGLKPLTCA
jgi:RimJ/RimL family protein N-acetyltransferase